MTDFFKDTVFNGEIIPEEELMDVNEVMKLLKMSRPTLYRHLKNGSPYKRSKGKEVDINQIPSFHIGGKRYWSKSALLELLKDKKQITCPKCGTIIR